MVTSESEASGSPQASKAAEGAVKARPQKHDSVLDKVLRLLSSVRFGVTMLMILLGMCIIGMLIMQVEVEGFQEYYQRLTPAQRLVYGSLGLFDIYHAWYFTFLLAVTGLNIILASIDRFPTAWQYYSNPKASASPNFIRAQMYNHEAEVMKRPSVMADDVKAAWKKHGFRAKIKEDGGRITVFAQKNLWNRFGAYVVHVALITIFIGGFLTNRYGVGGMMEIRPGKSSSTFNTFQMTLDGPRTSTAMLPVSDDGRTRIEIECTDLQQTLIRPEGGLEASNTIDWFSHVKIKDGDHVEEAVVHLNNPYDYRGYRLFQSQFTAVGNARQITIRLEPVSGGEAREVTIPRNGSAEVEGIGRIAYTEFFPDFKFEEGPTTASGDYNNPAAQLEVTSPAGQKRGMFAFNPQLAEQLYSQASGLAAERGVENPLLLNGNRVLLKGFEKVALGHTLSIQYDPGRLPVYAGFTLLVVALCGVFFFAHQRMWAVIEPSGSGSKVYFGGNTNRNRPAFEGRFNLLVSSVIGGGKYEPSHKAE
ncbi:MAG TPA: cytochrome c biogenesis protein ResB [Blastocatellia bacterium]|nr:cytochrome c biogenesis protein ResB [Blastocatellia bacterium]